MNTLAGTRRRVKQCTTTSVRYLVTHQVVVMLVLTAILTWVLLYPLPAAAAPILAPAAAIGDKINAFIDKLKPVGRALLTLALFVGLLMFVAEPVLPTLARENRGKIQSSIFAAICLGLVPDIVALVFGS